MSSLSRQSIRVIIVDDHPVYREGLRVILAREPGMLFAGAASKATDAYALAKTARPDVALIETALPRVDGFAVARELRRRTPACRILMLAIGDGHGMAKSAAAAGASGYLYGTQAAAEVVEAIRAVFNGERYVPVDGDGDGASRPDGLSALSTREREIFGLAVGGLSNDNMAQHLKISVKTVETHRAHINSKLGVHSTAELVRYAALHGLLPR
jgi:DNA-binding NarL/FixJ family response regulator